MIKTIPILKFKKGLSYSILKEHGYKFQPMYASNYMTWWKTVNDEEHGDHIIIWRKGNNVELVDLHGLSGLFAEHLRDIEYDKEKTTFEALGKLFRGISILELALNTETMEFEEYDYEKHDFSNVFYHMRNELKCSEEEIKEASKVFRKKYVIKRFCHDYVKMVKQMWQDGYVETILEKRKKI